MSARILFGVRASLVGSSSTTAGAAMSANGADKGRAPGDEAEIIGPDGGGSCIDAGDPVEGNGGTGDPVVAGA